MSTPSDTARSGTEPDEPQPDEPQPDEPQPDEPQPDEPQPDEPQPDEPQPDERQPGGPAATRAMRATRQRAAVSGLLDRVADFRSAQEIHEELRRVGEGIGLTTVYRTLQALADAGEVDVLRTGTGEAVYRRCASDDHHHHLVCRRCGRAVEIAGPAVETWAQRVADEHGFTDLSHTVEIFGLCRECSAARPTG